MATKSYKLTSLVTYNGSEEAIEQLQATTTELNEVKETLNGVITGTAQHILNQDDKGVVRDGAFDGCANLIEYSNIIGTLRSIGENAFRNCSSLVEIPYIQTDCTLGERAFQNCSNLNPTTTPGSLDVPAYCFEGCSSLNKQLTVKDGIGEYGFKNSGITRLNMSINTKVFNIYPYACENCTNLERVVFSNTGNQPVRIYDGAFKDCTSLRIFAGMYYAEYIGENAFQNCTGLTGVLLKENVTISPYAFNGCTNLAAITYQGTVEQARNIFSNGIGLGVPATIVVCTDGNYTIGS